MKGQYIKLEFCCKELSLKTSISTKKALEYLLIFIYRRLLLNSIYKLFAQVVFGIICMCFFLRTLGCIYLRSHACVYVDSLIMISIYEDPLSLLFSPFLYFMREMLL